MNYMKSRIEKPTRVFQQILAINLNLFCEEGYWIAQSEESEHYSVIKIELLRNIHHEVFETVQDCMVSFLLSDRPPTEISENVDRTVSRDPSLTTPGGSKFG